MHDLSLILGCMRSVIYFYEVNVVGNVFILFLFLRLTLGIGNFMSSHSLSAGHVPLGLGRDRKRDIFFLETTRPEALRTYKKTYFYENW